jgi:hypothetical protein
VTEKPDRERESLLGGELEEKEKGRGLINLFGNGNSGFFFVSWFWWACEDTREESWLSVVVREEGREEVEWSGVEWSGREEGRKRLVGELLLGVWMDVSECWERGWLLLFWSRRGEGGGRGGGVSMELRGC